MEYSGRELTIESDKLPALAGLAELYRQATGDQYLAGLWRSSLIVDLLWKRQRVLSCHGVLTSMPMEYRAPSWSWAALDGNVSFALSGRPQRLSEAEILGAYLDTIEGLDPPPGQWLWIRGALFEAHVGEDDVRISGEKLGASWLDIQVAGDDANIPAADPKQSKERRIQKQPLPPSLMRLAAGGRITSIESHESIFKPNAWCVVLAIDQGERFGLVLREKGARNETSSILVFERVGYFIVTDPDLKSFEDIISAKKSELFII